MKTFNVLKLIEALEPKPKTFHVYSNSLHLIFEDSYWVIDQEEEKLLGFSGNPNPDGDGVFCRASGFKNVDEDKMANMITTVLKVREDLKEEN